MSIHDCIQNIFFATVYGQAQNQGLAVSVARYQATGGPEITRSLFKPSQPT